MGVYTIPADPRTQLVIVVKSELSTVLCTVQYATLRYVTLRYLRYGTVRYSTRYLP